MTQAAPSLRRAIVDVGSNSVRLVIFEGPARTPFVIHNEKVPARLGRSLAATGRIDDEGYARAIRGARRFKALLDAMEVAEVRTVATAAARDAANGPEFLADLAATGLAPELLSGEEEALGAAAGVLSAFPGADGLVGDLGGGSLELVDLQAGEPGRCDSFPIGVLRVPALRDKGDARFAERIAKRLKARGWLERAGGRPFYLVGGSWRALGLIDLHLDDSPLPGVHGHTLLRERLPVLRAAVAELGPKLARMVPGVASSRVPTLDDAALLLEAVADAIDAGPLVVSTFGLREGLLYQALDPAVRAEDPLLAAVIDYGARHGNPAWHGDAVAAWIAPAFAGSRVADARIRRAACHLAEVDLHTQSESRARHGMELAWLGGWIGISVKERAMLAQALWTAWGGKGACPQVGACASETALRRAHGWGEAIRLVERYTGGNTAVLDTASLTRDKAQLVLTLRPAWRDLAGDVIAKQLAALAESLDLQPEIVAP